MKKKRKRLVRIEILPTLLTLGNLLCGFGALIFVIKGQFVSAAWLILLALGVFDTLDGKIARMTRSTSGFGAQLDALSDMVSFGAAPSFLVYQMINQGGYHIISSKFTFLLCAFYLVCVALRLARFNVETPVDLSAHQHFSGLPSPGAAGVIATLIILRGELILNYSSIGTQVVLVILSCLTLMMALLMISRLRYIHLLNRITRAKYPFIRVVEIILVVLLIAFQPEMTLCAGFLIYMLSGPVLYVRSYLFPRTKMIPISSGQPIVAHEKTDRTT